jgi:hypothetical protein
MTYILHHEAPVQSELQAQAKTAMRSARSALAFSQRAATGLVQAIASTPAAISRAFASAYSDPFLSNHRASDPSDPRNF